MNHASQKKRRKDWYQKPSIGVRALVINTELKKKNVTCVSCLYSRSYKCTFLELGAIKTDKSPNLRGMLKNRKDYQ